MDLAQQASDLASKSWDKVWALLGGDNSQLIEPVMEIGGFLAGICVLIAGFIWITNLNEKAVETVIYPFFVRCLIVMILLKAPYNITDVVLDLRDTVNGINKYVLESISAVTQFEQKLREIEQYVGGQQIINNLRQVCEPLKSEREKYIECLKAQKAKAEETLDLYKWRSEEWRRRAREEAGWIATASDDFQKWLGSGGDALMNTLRFIVQVLTTACHWAFQHAVEMVILIMAFLAPIAVATSLLPIGSGSPIVLWFTGIWAIGIAKVSLGIITGIAISIMYDTQADVILIGIFIGITSPFLALSMAAGGGMATFNSIMMAGSVMAGGAAVFGGKGVGAGVSGGASLAGKGINALKNRAKTKK